MSVRLSGQRISKVPTKVIESFQFSCRHLSFSLDEPPRSQMVLSRMKNTKGRISLSDCAQQTTKLHFIAHMCANFFRQQERWFFLQPRGI